MCSPRTLSKGFSGTNVSEYTHNVRTMYTLAHRTPARTHGHSQQYLDQYASLHLRISDAKHGRTSRSLARVCRHPLLDARTFIQTLHNALLTTSTNHTHTNTSRSHFGSSRFANGRKGNSCKRRRGSGCTCTIRSRERRGRWAGGGRSCRAAFPRKPRCPVLSRDTGPQYTPGTGGIFVCILVRRSKS
jgi:hypothetical protein